MEGLLRLIFLLCSLYLPESLAAVRNGTRRVPNFVGLVESHGYQARSYHVITEDGYKLRLHRISGSPLSPEAPGKPVVLLQHGILGCSELYVFWKPTDSLAYLLADAGYDVWVSNVRGSTNGRSHVTLSPNSSRFWDFNLNDLATKDIPAQVDFALQKTGQSCLTYIGHSMGTTLSYILLSEKPEYSKRINFVVSLAPVAFWRYRTASLLQVVLNTAVDTLRATLQAPDYAVEVLSPHTYVSGLMENYCRYVDSTLCTFLVNSFFEQAGTTQELSAKEVKRLMNYIPAGTSLKIFHHYRQMINSGIFKKYNYGNPARNFRAYGVDKPPVYNVKRIASKVALIWVHNDELAHQLNVRLLAERLRNVVTMEPVPSKQFHHSNFYFFKNGKGIIHRRIIQLVNKYHQCSM